MYQITQKQKQHIIIIIVVIILITIIIILNVYRTNTKPHISHEQKTIKKEHMAKRLECGGIELE